MRRNIQRALIGSQAGNNVETRFVNRAFRLLGVLKRYANLVAQLGTLILAQLSLGLVKVVFEQVEEVLVVLGGDAGVVQNKSAVLDEGLGGFGAFGAGFGGGGVVGEVDVEVDDGEFHGEGFVGHDGGDSL